MTELTYEQGPYFVPFLPFHYFLSSGRIGSIYSVIGPDIINFKATEQRFYTQNLKKLDKFNNENNPNDTNDLENSEMGKVSNQCTCPDRSYANCHRTTHRNCVVV